MACQIICLITRQVSSIGPGIFAFASRPASDPPVLFCVECLVVVIVAIMDVYGARVASYIHYG